ncbi:MAG: ABC transporter permease subunit, partial [Pseudomonadota bacterium]|nr:ABC transporter permease subunit [Pseudomonadota bacterium]
VFFALPVIGIKFNEIWAGVAALAFNLAGYTAEIVRGSVGAVEKGQAEAAKGIGMTREKILVYILLPQAARQMVPPFTNELITMIKSSSLLSVISVYELTRSGQAIISVHFVPFEIYGLLALYYWGLITAISWATRQLERRLPAW